MENDYKIIYKDSESIYVDIISLSPGLSANCEIFKGDFKGDDLYVGSISHKSLVYIAHNIAKHTYEKYSKVKSSEFELALFLAEEWCNGEESLELNKKINSNYKIISRVYDDKEYMSFALYTVVKLQDLIRVIPGRNYFSLRPVAVSAANASNSLEGEYTRQGRFILDFLNSDKHLFMV